MTRLPFALRTVVLVLALLSGSALRGRAQSAEGYTDILYDESNDQMLAFAITAADYDTLYYYVPHVHVMFMKEHDYYPYNVALGENDGTGGEIFDYALASVSAPVEAGVPYSAFAEHSIDIFFYDEVQCSWWDFYGYSMLSEPCEECHWDPEQGMYVCEVCEYRAWTPPQIPAWVYIATAVLGNTGREDVIPPVPMLHVMLNGSEVSQSQTVYITAGSAYSPPEIPPLTTFLTGLGGQLTGSTTWKINVQYNAHGRSDSNWFPSSSGTTLNSVEYWDVQSSFGSAMRGGTAKIQYKYNNHPWRDFNFNIGGTNPSEANAKTLLGSTPWFLTRIARQESGIKQFNTSAAPDWGSPNGWGMMKVDPPPGPQQLWHWWANVTEGKDRLEYKRTQPTLGLDDVWTARVQQWNTWNQGHPDKHVDPPPDKAEGTQPCTFKWNDGGYGSESVKSFKDACWIKRYNGAAADYIFWDTQDPNNENWGYNNDGGYVTAVCSKTP
jgi:hypothetical protein